jgi:hypothetical protein
LRRLLAPLTRLEAGSYQAGVRAVTRAQGHTTMMDRTYGLSEDASEARAESVGNLLVAAGIGG